MAAEHQNPIRAAFEARDVDQLEQSLSDDVVLRSPIFSVPIEGKRENVRLFQALFETLGEMDYVLDVPGDPGVLAWRSEVDGEPLEGIDLIRLDADGKVKEMRVFMRPLRGIAAFADATGPRLADSSGRRFLLRAAAVPPSLMMRALARFGPRMVGLGRRG
jgi:SnoaL-like domain